LGAKAVKGGEPMPIKPGMWQAHNKKLMKSANAGGKRQRPIRTLGSIRAYHMEEKKGP